MKRKFILVIIMIMFGIEMQKYLVHIENSRQIYRDNTHTYARKNIHMYKYNSQGHKNRNIFEKKKYYF